MSNKALSAETMIRQMEANGVTDVAWLPDSETNWLYPLMKADPDLRLVGVTREGHARPITAGLYAGGRKPMMLIQNTGMLESGGFDPGLADGAEGAGGADGGVSRLYAARGEYRYGSGLH